jgi:hypothetical protein
MNDKEQSHPQVFFYEKNGDLEVRQAEFVKFLREYGFGKIYAESEMSSSLVRVEDGIVHRTSKERIRDFVMGEVRSLPENVIREGYGKLDYEDALIRGANVYFGDNLLRSLPTIEVEFKRDTREEAFFYFENGF